MDGPHPEQTAVHEAGHAVAAHAFGWRVVELTIIPREVPGGIFAGEISVQGKPTIPETARSRDAAERFFLYCFAGPVAETLFVERPDPGARENATDYPLGDIGYCRPWLEMHAPGGRLGDYTEDLWTRAGRLLLPRRAAVLAVAAVLLRERELDARGFLRALPRVAVSPLFLTRR